MDKYVEDLFSAEFSMHKQGGNTMNLDEPAHHSEETSVKEHCVSNATRIISKTKKMSWEYSKTKYVTRCDKEFQRILLHKCTAFMH
jgi:hypothetical protein